MFMGVIARGATWWPEEAPEGLDEGKYLRAAHGRSLILIIYISIVATFGS